LYGVALPQGFDGNKGDFSYCSCISIVVLLYSMFGSEQVVSERGDFAIKNK
jgi:hypothetical protein